jgi:adenylate cyclase
MRYLFEDCVLDTGRREFHRGGHAVSLAPQVFDLIEHLIRNRERVVSKDDLIAAVWEGRIVSDAAVTTRINVARSAIGDSGEAQRLIKTLPRKGFRFVGAVREEVGGAASPPPAAAVPADLPGPELPLPDKPSIAILPFTNLSSDPEQDYFADGIVEDITTELSRFGELFVIARNSSFQYKRRAVDVRQVGRELGVRYVLEGSVRRSGDRLRISAQLIDAASGAHRWAERYARKLKDVFAVQDEVVGTIVAILAAHVRKAESERTRTKPPSHWQAYDYYLQANEAFTSFATSFDVERIYETRRLLQQSLAVDPGYARSYALLANTHDAVYVNRLDGDHLKPAVLDLAHRHACKAVELDPNLPEAHAEVGHVLTFMFQHDASVVSIEKAVALNPNYVDWRFGWPLALGGHPRRALDLLHTYMRLDPFHPPLVHFFVGVAHFVLGDYSRALEVLGAYVSRAPQLPFSSAWSWLAATHAQLGQIEEARAAIAEVLRVNPNASIAKSARKLVVFKHANDGEPYFEGLRKAGMPE